MKYVALAFLCSMAFAGDGVRGITDDIGEPLEIGGSSVHLVTSIAPGFDFNLESPELLPTFAPPTEYKEVESFHSRFIIPGKNGICPAVVSLSTETIEVSAEIKLTDQAQQSVDLAPEWLQGHLIWKFSRLREKYQDKYGAMLLAHKGENYYDELAFTVAYLSRTVLGSGVFDPELLVNNARGIYDHDSELSYVNVKDYAGPDYYSTTEYRTVTGSDTSWVEIPRDIYYFYVVMPKLSDETPKNDAIVYNEFWRQYIWDMDDSGYPIMNEVLNDNVLVFWDGNRKNYGWSHKVTFTDSLHAVDIVTGWVRAIIDNDASGVRYIQPNNIAHTHRGNCGEVQDLLCAAGRTALIPTVCAMDPLEDHVWCEAWWGDKWHGWYIDTFSNPYCAYDFDYGCQKQCSCIWDWRNDGYSWDRISYYSKSCTFTVTVTDSNSVPVDNATVTIASEGFGTSSGSIYQGRWGQTDRNGQITFELGDKQNYYLRIKTRLGNFGGSSNGYERVISSSIADKAYSFQWSPEGLMPELDFNKLSGGSFTKYLLQIKYDLPVDILVGKGYKSSEYALPLEGGTADFFIVDSANWALYNADQKFDCYELIQGKDAGEVWFYAPHTDDWHIVFSSEQHHNLETFADATITLWEHDGTGLSEGFIPALETSIFPNPCVNQASVSFATAIMGHAEVVVYDINGRVVETLCNEQIEAGSHNLTLETAELTSGLYFVKFTGEGLNSMRSLTVLR